MPNLELISRDLKVALRSLARTKGLAITVILTLALGIGANAAIFSVVRGVLLRPLVNRDEESPDLHPPKRPRHRRRKHQLLRPRNPGSAIARKNRQPVRRLLHDRFHHGRPRRTPRSPRRRRRTAPTST